MKHSAKATPHLESIQVTITNSFLFLKWRFFFFCFFCLRLQTDAAARLRRRAWARSEPAGLHLRYLRLQSGAIVARNVVGKCVTWFSKAFGLNAGLSVRSPDSKRRSQEVGWLVVKHYRKSNLAGWGWDWDSNYFLFFDCEKYREVEKCEVEDV
ncbi:hypothetical protein Tco_0722371 [Tanacetum coccineum]